jgi:hypothetical protein
MTSCYSPAEKALRHSPIPALRQLEVQETDAGLVLSGTVTSFYLKQLAQETVLPLVGHRGLVNQVHVHR